MSLKSPSIVVYIFSVVLVVAALMTKFAGATVPFLQGHEFWALLFAYALLAVNSLTR